MKGGCASITMNDMAFEQRLIESEFNATVEADAEVTVGQVLQYLQDMIKSYEEINAEHPDDEPFDPLGMTFCVQPSNPFGKCSVDCVDGGSFCLGLPKWAIKK